MIGGRQWVLALPTHAELQGGACASVAFCWLLLLLFNSSGDLHQLTGNGNTLRFSQLPTQHNVLGLHYLQQLTYVLGVIALYAV